MTDELRRKTRTVADESSVWPCVLRLGQICVANMNSMNENTYPWWTIRSPFKIMVVSTRVDPCYPASQRKVAVLRVWSLGGVLW